MDLSPIIIFSYDRPKHLQRTIDALAKNEFAAESDLFIYCDGAKPSASDVQINSILENRTIAKMAKGFKTVRVIDRDTNYGLARNIIEGVSEIIHKYGRVIVLEDDLLTSPFFLHYMNKALDFYQYRPGVMSISANRPPMSLMQIPSDYEYDVFVSLRSYSTGWGTWKDRWERVDWSMNYMEDFLIHPRQIEAFNRCGDDVTKMLTYQRDGKIDSWAIRFGFAHFKEHCVAILPCVPYVDNIGFDGTGRHSGVDLAGVYRNDLSLSVEEPRLLDLIYEDSRIINAFYNRFCLKKRPFWQKACNFMARLFRIKPPFVIKKKIYSE